MKWLQLITNSLTKGTTEPTAITGFAAVLQTALRVVLSDLCKRRLGSQCRDRDAAAAGQLDDADSVVQQQQSLLPQQHWIPALFVQQQHATTHLPCMAKTGGGSSSSSLCNHHQYHSIRQASSSSRRSSSGMGNPVTSAAAAATRKQMFLGSSDQSSSLSDLQNHMAAVGIPEAVAAAVLSKANTWPSLSRDPVEIVHRIHKLQEMMGSAAAAHDIIMTHPQLLTRPPAALEQQIYNLVDWLRVPILPQQQQQQQRQQQPDSQALQACEDFMQFIRTSPGCLSMSKDHVMRQLAAVQSLLLLPALPELADDEIRALEQLINEAQQQQQQQSQQQQSQQQQQQQSGEVAWLTKELQHLQERKQQVADVFSAWRAQQQQQQQPEQQQQQQQQWTYGLPQISSSSSRWSWYLVKQAPEWLMIDPVTTMSRRVDYLARLFFEPATAAAASSSSSLQMKRQITDLLLSAPQLITVSPSHIPAKIKVLAKLLLQHPAVINSQDYAYWMTNPKERLVIPTLLQAPLLLLPTAKHLEQRGGELRLLLPLLPLHHMINLLQQQQQLHWQQFWYLSHAGVLPLHPSKLQWQQQQQRVRQRQHQQQQHELAETWSAWGFAEYNAAVNALVTNEVRFNAMHPDYVSWRAARAAVEQSVRDGRESWGWLSEFHHELTGGDFKAWLSSMQGNWHRLLLLTMNKPWITISSSSSSSRIRSRPRKPTTSASSSSSSSAASTRVALKQSPVLAVQEFPYRPSAALGPMIFDLPEQQQQHLLSSSGSGSSSSKTALGLTLSQMSVLWQQLVAAAAMQPIWQQQLDQVLNLLPKALAAASGSSSNQASSSSSSWIDGVIESRSTEQQAAAAAARHRFWQQLQQPGIIDQLIQRLHFLHQLGVDQQQQQQNPSSSSSSSSSMHDLWPALVSDQAAFTAAYPEFGVYLQSKTITDDKAAWRSELEAMHGSDLLLLLKQAAENWSRIEYLTADSSSSGSSSGSSSSDNHGGLWQAISLGDAVRSSDDQFLEIFPDYKFRSWKTIAAMRQTNTTAAVGSSDHDDRRITISQDPASAETAAAAAAPPSSVIKSPNVDLAAQRLQSLQQYAALHPKWLSELTTWPEASWSSAARIFTPMRARRLEFILQLTQVHGEDGDTVGSSQSGGNLHGEVPGLHSVVLSVNAWFNGKYREFKPWLEIGQIVQAIPRWAADWQSLKGHQLQQTMNNVINLKAADLKQVYQQAYEAHLAELRAGSSSSSSSSKLPKELAMLQVGVTGMSSSARSGSSSSSSGQLSSDTAAATATPKLTTLQQQQQQLLADSSSSTAAANRRQSGLDLVLHRLRFFSRFRANAAVLHSLSLLDVLTQPQEQLAERYKALDPDLTAAKNQGLADAEARVLEEAYPWLGPKAVKPEVLQNLSPGAKRVLARRPYDLLLLQQLAHTWPAWEQQLQDVSAAGLSRLLEHMSSRSERLQVMARAGIQKYNSLRSVLLMNEETWRARYPIAQQLKELQAAAEGVSAWERTLSSSPSGRELLASIDKLHLRRGRLVFLKEEGLVEGGINALKVLRQSEERFMREYPDYPGDDDMSEQLTPDD